MERLLRDAQTMDGGNALPDSKTERGERRDELECARLQLEAGDEDHRHRRLVEGDDGVKRQLLLLQEVPQRFIRALKRYRR